MQKIVYYEEYKKSWGLPARKPYKAGFEAIH